MSSCSELPSLLSPYTSIWLVGAALLACGGKTREAIETRTPMAPTMAPNDDGELDVGAKPPGDAKPPSDAKPPGDAKPPSDAKPPGDAQAPDNHETLPQRPACAGDAPFSDPVEVLIDTGLSFAGAWLSDDGLELVVGARADALADDAQAYDLMRAVRSLPDESFGALSPIEELNTQLIDRNPTLTADGLTLYFESNRSGGSSDIFVAERSARGAAFGEARLAEPVSTKRNDVPSAVSLHTNSLFFSADRLDGPGHENIYQAARQANDAFGETFLISSIDSDASNIAPAPSSDELTLYFSSNRDSPDLGYDVYRARRSSLESYYGLPVVVAELSSSESDVLAWLSSDECRILFTRETPTGSGHVALLMASR